MSESRVYFIQAGEDGPIKIGFSTFIKERLRDLQVGSAEKLRILAHCPGGEELERHFHTQFAPHRKEGEWFVPHADILDAAERLTKQFDQSLGREKAANDRQAAFLSKTFAAALKAAYGMEPGWRRVAAEDANVTDAAVSHWLNRPSMPHMAAIFNLTKRSEVIAGWFFVASVACWVADECDCDEDHALRKCFKAPTLVRRAWQCEGQDVLSDILQQIYRTE